MLGKRSRPSRHAVIVGGTGYIGNRLTTALVDHGWAVTTFALVPGRDHPIGASFIQGDRRNGDDLNRLREIPDADAVVDLVAYRASDTKSMVDVWVGRTGLFVHLSTIAVYRRLLAPIANEDQAERWDPKQEGYGAAKATSDRELEASSDFYSIILRSAPIMGPADPVSRENYFLKRILDGRRLLHPGPVDGYIHVLYINDLIGALLSAVDRSSGRCRAYNLAQSEPLSLRRHVAAIGHMAGRPDARIDELSLDLVAKQGMRLCGFPFGLPASQRLSIERAATELGFEPTPYVEALQNTVRHFLPQPRAYAAWPGRGSNQSRLCGTHEWLHADQERFLDTSVPPPRQQEADEPLRWLAGQYGGASPAAILSSDSWQVCQSQQADFCTEGGPAPQPALVVPKPVFVTLTQAAGLSEIGQAGYAAPADPVLRLAGVIERKFEGNDHSSWLYTHTASEGSLGYGQGTTVLNVRFVNFGELDLKHVGADERVLAMINGRSDAETLIRFLEDCEERGWVRLPSLASYGRVFLSHVCRWIGRSTHSSAELLTQSRKRLPLCACSWRSQQEDEPMSCFSLPAFLAASYTALRARSPKAGLWACVFELARLLLRSGVEQLDGPQVLLLSTPRHWLIQVPLAVSSRQASGPFRLGTAVRLFRLGSRSFAADMAGDRLFELAPRVVAVAEVVRRTEVEADAIRILVDTLQVDLIEAEHTLRDGLAVLLPAKILERRPGARTREEA
jgi:nucleoside-diphosphate-sugar epimerase